jgi:hypothetical protein
VENIIENKRIFLMCENFFNYDRLMRKVLLNLGAKEVYLHPVVWIHSTLRGKITWKTPIYFLLHPNERKRWTEKLIADIDNRRFDIFLCIQITPFSKFFMDWLRSRNPNIKCILFLWDTVDSVMKGYEDYFPLFDKIWTFDRDDSKKYGFEYQPDFYISDDTVEYLRCRYDLNFIGNLSRNPQVYNRPRLLKYLMDFSSENHLNSFLYLKYQAKPSIFYRYLKITTNYEKICRKYKKYSFMKTESLPLNQVELLQQDARIIVDLSHENRQGMTINAITALAKGKKLITTNKRIKEENFYNPKNIYILDSANPYININFLLSDPVPIDMSYLRIDNWLKTIIKFD